MAKAKHKDHSEIFYVGIKEPSAVRRSLLESSKTFVEELQRYEQFKVIRERKAAEIARFREDVKELNRLIIGLRKILPKTKLKEAVVKQAEKKAVKPKKIEKKAEAKLVRPVSDLQKLESELGDIEAKLSKLR